MKKTLLSLVLAGLATAAFAGEVYNYESASSKASVELNTEAGFNYVATRTLVDVHSAIYNPENKYLPYLKLRSDTQAFQPFVNFTAYGEASDLESGLKFAFVSNISSSYSYKKARVTVNKKPIVYEKFTDHLMSSPRVEEIAFTIGTDDMGYFRIGKTSTAANTAFAPMNSNNPFNDYEKTSISARLAFDEVIAYEAPVWKGLSAAVSFAKEHQAKYEFTNQVAGHVKFKAYGADVALTGYRNLLKADHHSQSVTKGISLSAAYTAYQTNFTFGAGYETTHNKQVPADLTLDHLYKAWNLGLEASYDGFQYAKPYAGVYFVNKTNRSFDRNGKQHTKVLNTTLGVQSDVYHADNINVNLYVEGGYSRKVNRKWIRKPNNNYKLWNQEEFRPFYVATGVTLSF